LPAGLIFVPDFLSIPEESEVAEFLASLPFRTFEIEQAIIDLLDANA